MGAGVQQILAFEVDFRAAQLAGQTRGQVQRGRTSGIVPQQQIELGVEDWIRLRFGIGVLQLFQSGHQSLGNVASPIGAKTAGNGIGDGAHVFLPRNSSSGADPSRFLRKAGYHDFRYQLGSRTAFRWATFSMQD